MLSPRPMRGAGTSPRMRGKPQAKVETSTKRRNIPAYAGKTGTRNTVACDDWEHPRVCGENLKGVPPAAAKLGTSPRMRGKHSILVTVGCAGRNIPAYAGKTIGQLVNDWDTAEHPRVCGENKARIKSISFPCGTSPRMRGKPLRLAA